MNATPSPPVRSAVVLAGGLGKRLRSAVPDLPKPMAPVAGVPFLARLMAHWIGQGIHHFVLSVGYRHEAISGYFGRSWRGARIDYGVEDTPLGTGGGLTLAMIGLDLQQRFLLLNGDTFFDVDLAALSRFAQVQDADWCFSLFRFQEEGRYMGMDLDSDGRIRALVAGANGPRLANGGVYLVHPRSLVAVEQGRAASLENDLFPSFLAQGQVFAGLESPGRFIDIGVPADYLRAAEVLPPFIVAETSHD